MPMVCVRSHTCTRMVLCTVHSSTQQTVESCLMYEKLFKLYEYLCRDQNLFIEKGVPILMNFIARVT